MRKECSLNVALAISHPFFLLGLMRPWARAEWSAWVTQQVIRGRKPKLAFRAQRHPPCLKRTLRVTADNPQGTTLWPMGLFVRKGQLSADCCALRESVPLAAPPSPEFGCISSSVPKVNISSFYTFPLRLAGRHTAWHVSSLILCPHPSRTVVLLVRM